MLGAFLEVEISKKCTPLWREAHVEVKMYKGPQCRTAFGSWHVEEVHALVARSAFPSQNVKNTTCSDHFCRFKFRFASQAQGIVHPAKSVQNVRVGGVWRGSAKMNFAWQGQYKRHVHQRCQEVRAEISWEGLHFGAQIVKFAKMILRDRWSTSYDLASLFRGRRSTFDRWSGKIRKMHLYEAVSPALKSPFLKDVSQNCVLMLTTPKIEEVSQNCFMFDAVKFKNWGSLAELLRFWCCQVQKLRKSCRIASFSSLQIDR